MQMQSAFFFTLWVLILQTGRSQIPAEYDSYLQNSLQAIVVSAKRGDTRGFLIFYERNSAEANWEERLHCTVQIGRNGFAADGAFHPEAPVTKYEGDGCSPAGVYSLGPVFSYHPLHGLKMPFQQVDSSDLCVDDVQSNYYNRLIDSDTIALRDWKSYENMRRRDGQYEYGIWVNYNTDATIPGRGSCIFLHVWLNSDTPTSGCTAMEKENLLQLIYLLDAKRHPLLIQYILE